MICLPMLGSGCRRAGAPEETPMLLRGEGRYTDDVNLPRQVYAAMVRSRHAHGIIRGIETASARTMPGVLGIYVATDVDASGIGPIVNNMKIANRDGTPMHTPDRPALPRDRVRFVGEVVAFVVAETPLQAKDAAEVVEVDIEPLPEVMNAAAAHTMPPIHPGWADNQVLDFHHGDSGKVEAALAGDRDRRESTTVAWWYVPWNRARRWRNTTPSATSGPCILQARACSCCEGPWHATSSIPPPTRCGC